MSGFQNIGRIPELKRRIIMTLALLAVYRIGVHIPTPGVDGSVLASIYGSAAGHVSSASSTCSWAEGSRGFPSLPWASCRTSARPSYSNSSPLSFLPSRSFRRKGRRAEGRYPVHPLRYCRHKPYPGFRHRRWPGADERRRGHWSSTTPAGASGL